MSKEKLWDHFYACWSDSGFGAKSRGSNNDAKNLCSALAVFIYNETRAEQAKSTTVDVETRTPSSYRKRGVKFEVATQLEY